MNDPTKEHLDIRNRLHHAIMHMEHRLVAQAPLKDFVHHNTLHAFQEYPFAAALTMAGKETGFDTFLSPVRCRELLRRGRIVREDLMAVILGDASLEGEALIGEVQGRKLCRKEVLLCGLIHDISAISATQLPWYIEEEEALQRFQPDLSQEMGQEILQSSGQTSESLAVGDLWSACLEVLSLHYRPGHPEELLDLSADQAEAMITEFAQRTGSQEGESFRVRLQVRAEAVALLDELLQRIGPEWTVRRFLLAVTGTDILESIQPLLIRQMSNHMDLGIAAWQSGVKTEGFYTFWRQCALRDLGWIFDEMSDWGEQVDQLPPNALDAIIAEMLALGLPETRWADYLGRVCQELPGWSGMFAWRQNHPHYAGSDAGLALADYLAVRLILERLFAQGLCRRTWKISPNLFFLRWYFHNNKSELLVRHALFNLSLPDHIIHHAQSLKDADPPPSIEEWRAVAHLIWTWRRGGTAVGTSMNKHTLHQSGWRLFRLAQHLGLSGPSLRTLSLAQVELMLKCLDGLTPETSGFLWLQAYERRYRDQLFNAVCQNHSQGAWATRGQSQERPVAQVVFCMDDREEGIRRHLEEHNPAIETLGAAGFFGVAINWKGLDDRFESALCPIVDKPSNKVLEVVEPEKKSRKHDHDRRLLTLGRLKNFLFNASRHTLVRGMAAVVLTAPVVLLSLTVKQWFPTGYGRWTRKIKTAWLPPLETVITVTAPDDGRMASPEHNRLGFTDSEQAQRVGKFLRVIGLTSGFAPLVVMMGHGSDSKNNPHRAAYDCGACSGRHGGPNARVFAAMANRLKVRAILAKGGILIPQETLFVAANHNTCDESFTWYDGADIPPAAQPLVQQCISDIEYAARMSAQERCRKVVSSPDDPDPALALEHVQGRGQDISQARPELGHVTNAAAFVGRRSLSHGLFLDRRVFLISYDPLSDPEGEILEAILLNVTPVGAGINLEYYFSTVDNERMGCGSKVTHNITGFFGVMDGTASDLRTGLPYQMIEIHEAMRLQIMVEASTQILTTIYQRQPLLQELVGNGWVLLSAKNPDSPEIHVFEPSRGWVVWENQRSPLPVVASSSVWYRGNRDHLGPARIQTAQGVRHG
ncbi:MAG: DUF2309 domain-containing protein [Nitrospirae bacterium]|nr:DUF2309 domain-containing protein [Magnetococcales bacterium]